jgi:hypothetical protein
MFTLFEDVVRDAMLKRMTFDTIGADGRLLRGLIRPRKAHASRAPSQLSNDWGSSRCRAEFKWLVKWFEGLA